MSTRSSSVRKKDSPKKSSNDNPVRQRKCTEEGTEYFQEQCSKNKDRSRKKVFKLINEIEENIQHNKIDSVAALIVPLNNAYEEFNRDRLRYCEVYAVDSPEEFEDVSKEVNLCKDKMNTALEDSSRKMGKVGSTAGRGMDFEAERRSIYKQIEKKMQEIDALILENNLAGADNIMLEMDSLFSEFMSFTHSSAPWYVGEADEHDNNRHLQPGIDAEKERDFTDRVDNAVFSIKKKLFAAKAELEVRNAHGSHSTLSTRSPVPSRAASVESNKWLINGGNIAGHTTRHESLHYVPSRQPSPPRSVLIERRNVSDHRKTPLLNDQSTRHQLALHGKTLLPLYNSYNALLPPRTQTSERSKSRTGRSRSKCSQQSLLSHRSKSNIDDTGSQHSRSSRSRSKCSQKSLLSHRSRSNIDDSGSQHSRSSRSRSSSNCSSASSARGKAIEEKAKLEALKVEAKFLEESQKRETEKRRLEMESERLDVEREIAMAEAKAKVYNAHTETIQKGTQSEHSPIGDSSILLDNYMNKLKTKNDSNSGEINTSSAVTNGNANGLSHLNDLCNFLKVQSAPDIDMDYFSGNPLDYQYFMSLFEELIEKKIDDPFGKLARLIKYTRGEAKELIQHCSQMPQPDGYLLAKDLLEKEYGDPHKVTSAYMRELDSWKTIRTGNVDDFKKFYRFLLKCNTNRKGDVYLRLLDNPETLRSIQSKLPHKLQERWTRKAVQYRETNRKELDFSHFLEFVRMECKVLDDPVYSHVQNNSDDKNKADPRNSGRDYYNKTDKTDKTIYNQTAFSSQVTETHAACLYCAEEHDIDSCEKFLQLTLKEKKGYLYQQKICFYCYRLFSADKHGLNKCEYKRTCTICSQAHPTALHKEDKPKPDIQMSRAIHTEEESTDKEIGMPILPVKVYHRDHPKKYVVVYAMLDNCSSGVFILQDCVDKLGLETDLVPVVVKTVIGMTKCHMKKVDPGLMVAGIGDNTTPIEIKKAYSKDDLSIDHNEIVTIDTLKQWDYLENVTKEFHRYGNDIPIAMIIGSNVQKAVEQIESIPSRNDGPFAFRTQLGWCVAGPVSSRQSGAIKCNRIRVMDISTNSIAEHQFVVKEDIQDVSIAGKLQEMYMNDFNEIRSEKKVLSVEDEKFLQIMESEGKLVDNHHQLPLPLRNKEPNLPNNKPMAVKRAYSIKRRMLRDDEYRTNYVKFMTDLLSRGHAQKVDPTKKVEKGMVWFVSHHGVYHPKTKKFRVVMACNAEYQGRSLNAELIPGPDNTNLMLGVLLRFRQNSIPYMGDLEQMFYQIHVPEEQRSLLRFLWWPNGDLSKELEENEMCVHLFGAVSSPSVAGYALRKTATDNSEKYGEAAARAVCRNFYVDDLCKSEDSVPESVDMIANISAMCAAGGFNLTKLVSSHREVLNSIPISKRAKELQVYDLSSMGLPSTRALGILWGVENDVLGCRVQFSEKNLSRKTILSDISSIFDPDGRFCAFVLPGKKILQEITGQKIDWNAAVSAEHAERWDKWKSEMTLLETLNLPRCFRPTEFGKPVSQTLHCFSDGSNIGYGQASYIRSTNAAGDHHVSLVIGKARVAPLKSVTIPRLELTAATVSVKVGDLIQEELDVSDLTVTYWTDSTIVLGYIANETTRFRTYERNRVNTIHRYSNKDAWRHVPTDENPADLASRGLSPRCKGKVDMWFNGPSFLWKDESEWPPNIVTPLENGEEDTPITTYKTSIQQPDVSDFKMLSTLETRFSSWYRLVRTVAFLKRCVQVWIARREEKPYPCLANRLKSALSVADIRSAEDQVIKLTQHKYMSAEVERLTNKNTTRELRKSSTIFKLNPFMDRGLIRVGGRFKNCNEGINNKHPVVIPKKSAASSLLIRKAHNEVAHCGRCSTLNKLREDGFWVVGAHTAVKSYIHKCRRCRELRGKLGEQKMADLPPERVTPSPPFSFCGADMFGPFLVKEGRKELKRYGCIFTCMSCRAVHIEVTSKLDADTFIQALRRFIARRGQVRSIRTDNGTNFIGAENELKKALDEMDNDKIREFLTAKGCDWIVWERNPPEASHMGGVWERQIRSVRTILTALLKEHSTILNDESLRTFMAETEAIINSRPLTVDNLSDPDSPVPLSPMQLLTFKSDVVFPPPGKFERPDVYSRKHWRRVQYLANEFWSRWKTEYLTTLQARQKWTKKSRNFMVGDVVLVKDSNIFTKRNGWPMALVEEVFPADDGLVRHVKLRVAYKQEDKTRFLSRPISKLILLVGVDEQE